ncbi:ArsR family transcriptional regulator [Candidatus Kaiserbacteria bacterium]|nr:ArsR family transcriptional regulator [Candidatus Kaiserbacteria bacterium]
MNTLKDTEQQLKALANKRRLTILKYLNAKGPASVGSVADEIKLSFKSTSNHLLILAKADLLEREQTSTTVLYRLVRPTSPVMKTVLTIL